VLVGTGMGGLTVFSDSVQNLIEKGCRKITRFFITYAITNMWFALLGMDIGFMGPNYSISTVCATSNYCFYAATNHIHRGEADIVVAGGTEAAINPIGVGGFVACRALSHRGMMTLKLHLGLGTRNVMVLSWVKGLEYWYDLVTLIWPFIFANALRFRWMKKLTWYFQVNYINAHAISTLAGDLAEVSSIKQVFKGPSGIKINATKVLYLKYST
jgi:3-oxoacyl-[acyl-carrier-protein] synthase II